jgi:quercetin dioxygenase-like cupin family protein
LEEGKMTKRNPMGAAARVAGGAILLGVVLSQLAAADDSHHVVVSPDALKWVPAPPAFPPGQEFAVVVGDPGKAEPYVVRARAPAGYKIPPHTHPGNESLTVLSGSLHIGMGDKFDESKRTTIKAGGFALVAKGMPHYVWFTEPTVIQAHGMGPVTIGYINPVDDPRKK